MEKKVFFTVKIFNCKILQPKFETLPMIFQCIFDMLSNYIINDVGAKSVVIKTSGNVTCKLPDNIKPSHVTMN